MTLHDTTAEKKENKSAIQRRLIPTYIFLTIVSIFSVFPLYWMITAATNTSLEVAQGKIWFGSYLMENFHNLLKSQALFTAMGNSFLYATVQTVLCLFICSLAGYGFELYHDQAKDRLFAILLLGMMIPTFSCLIPMFQIYNMLGLRNTYAAVVLPQIGFSLPMCIVLYVGFM